MKVKSSTIQNKFLRVQTLNYGASLFEVYHKKKKINLILNLGSKQNYRYKHPSVGSTCGRYAGRISNAKFKIGNKKYNLNANEGKNILHGGKVGFSILPWKKLNQTKDKVVYQLHSANDDQGFPGDLVVNCTYQLINKYLFIKYEYKSNKSTHVNLTNHSYWNLEKNKKNMIYSHELKLNSSKYLQINKNLIPTGRFKNVNKSIYDFSNFQNVRKKLDCKLIKKASLFLKGTHDLSVFRASNCSASSPIRTIDSLIIKQNNDIIEIKIKSRSFLKQQVRSIVGCLKYVGEKKWTINKFRKVLKSKNRNLCAPPAPGTGLYLEKVIY